MTLCGRWLRADEAAHVTLSTQRESRRGGMRKRKRADVVNQPVVGIAAGVDLTDAHGSSHVEWLLCFTTSPRGEPLIGGSLARKQGVPPFLVSDAECLEPECESFRADVEYFGLRDSGLSASDEKGACDPWTTCTLSLRGGAVKLECNRDTKSKTNLERAMTVALPPNVGPIAFVVRENFNDPLRIVGGAMPAPPALVRASGVAALVEAMERSHANNCEGGAEFEAMKAAVARERKEAEDACFVGMESEGMESE